MGKPIKIRRRRHVGLTVAMTLLAVLFTGYLLVFALNRRLFPIALEITALRGSSLVNRAIGDALSAFSDAGGYSAADFYVQSTDGAGKVASLAVNTVLANRACAELAQMICARLDAVEAQRVYVPLGTAFGGGLFSTWGPKLPVAVLPVGDAVVEYTSVFESAGLNQIHFQITLQIRTTVRAVNTLQTAETSVTRSVALVDTVFAGELPNAYIHIK